MAVETVLICDNCDKRHIFVAVKNAIRFIEIGPSGNPIGRYVPSLKTLSVMSLHEELAKVYLNVDGEICSIFNGTKLPNSWIMSDASLLCNECAQLFGLEDT